MKQTLEMQITPREAVRVWRSYMGLYVRRKMLGILRLHVLVLVAEIFLVGVIFGQGAQRMPEVYWPFLGLQLPFVVGYIWQWVRRNMVLRTMKAAKEEDLLTEISWDEEKVEFAGEYGKEELKWSLFDGCQLFPGYIALIVKGNVMHLLSPTMFVGEGYEVFVEVVMGKMKEEPT